ncbi:protein mobD, partial [Acidithiobacillus ferrivorans]|nr:protein mobD [Acidithiobacillus ferrivorans]
MKQTIIFSHGDKGGVGKSVVAALLVDMALQRFGKASLIEGDTTTPDVYGRYS